MLAEPEPFRKRGQEWYFVFLSMKRMGRFVKAFRELTEAISGGMDEEEAIQGCARLGQVFLYKKDGPLSLRPCTEDEITDWLVPHEFIGLVHRYLDLSGWTQPAGNPQTAEPSPTGDSSSPA